MTEHALKRQGGSGEVRAPRGPISREATDQAARRAASEAVSRSESAEVADLGRQFSHDAILRGVSARVVKQAVAHRLLRQEEVHRLIPPSTLARKVRESRALSREEADQVARLLRIKAYARDVFEDTETAEVWLNEPNPALGGRLPAELLVTDEGTRAVETVLRRIDYGDYT